MWRWYLNSSFQPYNYYIKTYGRGWWDKYQYQLFGMHVEEKDEKGREYTGRRKQWETGIDKLREKHCSNKNWLCKQTWKKYIRTDLPRTIFFNINVFFILLSSESTLVFVWFNKAQFFQLTLYKFIVLAFWAWIRQPFG